MGSLALSYWFWFFLAGALGLAIGWGLRHLAMTRRLSELERDIEEFERATISARERTTPVDVVVES